MEQYSQYLMVVKSNNSIFINPFSSRSWEEQAFAEDAQGPLGGFVWPPRAYSCSFCGREFRSAQALGGHMNVHRRERAKLKQTVNGTNSTNNAISTTTIAPQKHKKKSLVCKSLGQESLDGNSDTKSGVYDEDFVATRGNGTNVERNLVLGFDLDYSLKRGSGCKRQKTAGAPPVMEGLDLELRLASKLKHPNKLRK